MITLAQLKFIVIDKQKDLPTDSEMKDVLHGATRLNEIVMPNGDIIISNKNISYPLNEKATAICGEEVWGHCYLIKKKLNIYIHKLKEFLHGHRSLKHGRHGHK